MSGIRVERASDGRLLDLDESCLLGAGGEARVFAVPSDRSRVAKIYHKPTESHERKLVAMLAAPPEDPMRAHGQPSIAWPTEILRAADGSGRMAGFLMPRVSGMRPIIDFYNPRTRRQQGPLFSYQYLLHTARNLAAAVQALHARGYVLGDVNESNILVSDTSLITLVDTDSFQVCDPETGTIYRCRVGKPEFTPPELYGAKFSEVDRAPEHDLFGLAVLIFQLLMEGTHPFAGIYAGSGEPPPTEARIRAGHFPYGKSGSAIYRPMPIAPPFRTLHPCLRELFACCFEDGHLAPRVRPDARTWQAALSEAEDALVTCPVNAQHRFGGHLGACPWCERTALLGGRDPFPSQTAVQRGEHRQEAPRAQTPLPRAAASAASSTAPPASRFPQTPARPVTVAAAPTAAPVQPSAALPTPPPVTGESINFCAWVAWLSVFLALLPECRLWAGLAAILWGGAGLHQAHARGGRGRWLSRLAAVTGLVVALAGPLVQGVLQPYLFRPLARIAGRLAPGSRATALARRLTRLSPSGAPTRHGVPERSGAAAFGETSRRRLAARLEQPAHRAARRAPSPKTRKPRRQPRAGPHSSSRRSVVVVAGGSVRWEPAAATRTRSDTRRLAVKASSPPGDARRQQRYRELAADLAARDRERERRHRELAEDLARREQERQQRHRELAEDLAARRASP